MLKNRTLGVNRASLPRQLFYGPKWFVLGTNNIRDLHCKKCLDVFSNIMIGSDGSVIPAHGRCYNLTVGNLYNEPLKDVWNSATLGRFREDLNKAGGLLPACSRCCSAF